MKLNQELVKYITNEIFPMYRKNEEGHGIEHIKNVIEKSLELAKKQNVNLDMVFTVATYHDIGHHIDRKNHEVISAEIFMNDENIKKWFDDKQIITIKEAIEDHRASSDHIPRSIYGMIVSTADRAIIDIDSMVKRTYFYGIKHFPELSYDEQVERVYTHLIEKYGEGGYAKIYLEDKEYDESLQKLIQALSNKVEFINRVKSTIN